MLEIFNDINRVTKLYQRYALVTMLCSLAFGLVVFSFAMKVVGEEREKVYVLSRDGSVLEFALRNRIEENRPAEVENHVLRFHELLYTINPDKQFIESNGKRLLHYGDQSVKQVYDLMKERGYFEDLIKQRISSFLVVDSIKISSSIEPYTVLFYGKNELNRSSSDLTKRIITRCQVHDIARSRNNPHGLMIRDFTILRNEIINDGQ